MPSNFTTLPSGLQVLTATPTGDAGVALNLNFRLLDGILEGTSPLDVTIDGSVQVNSLVLGGGTATITSDNDGGINFTDEGGYILQWNAWDNSGLNLALGAGSSTGAPITGVQEIIQYANLWAFYNDGSGLLANNNINWDGSGNLHATTLYGDGSNLTGITASQVGADPAGSAASAQAAAEAASDPVGTATAALIAALAGPSASTPYASTGAAGAARAWDTNSPSFAAYSPAAGEIWNSSPTQLQQVITYLNIWANALRAALNAAAIVGYSDPGPP